MFFIAAAHLALLMEEASGGILPTPGVGKALIVLATFQVRYNRNPSLVRLTYPRLCSLLLAT